jgi:hypothetical protein
MRPTRWFSSPFWRGFFSLNLFPVRNSPKDRRSKAGPSGRVDGPLGDNTCDIYDQSQKLLEQSWEQVGHHMRSAMSQVEAGMTDEKRDHLNLLRQKAPDQI